MEKEWKSPRRIEEELKQYRHQRFERYMQMVDDGKLTRALAIAALREELASDLLTLEQDVTQPGSVPQSPDGVQL